VFGIAALDVGYESPLFGAIERVVRSDEPFDPKAVPKKLVFYELDMGINVIARKSEFSISPSSTHLVALPGPLFGFAGGVIVCGNGSAQYSRKSDGPP
jgi:hypothetical protein